MAHMYHRPGPPAAGQKALLATPAYQSVGAGYAFALFHTARALADAGIGAEYAVLAEECHVDDARNRIVRDFLDSDCTDLVFLDADLRWESADLVRLLGYDRGVVGATYPLKEAEENYPVKWLDDEVWADDDGLVEVAGLPTGFLRIRRRVLETLAAEAPKFMAKDGRGALPLIFERTMADGVRWGGDYTFCRKWRAMGGQIFLMPEAEMEHSGQWQFTGSAGHWLRRNGMGALAAGLEAIRAGRETAAILDEMRVAWGNDWAMTAEGLEAAIALARAAKGPILEMGAGLTTLMMAAACPGRDIHAVEHDPDWSRRVRAALADSGLTATVYDAPLVGGRYRLPEGMEKRDYGLVLVDGPPRDLGVRDQALGIGADVYLFDDADGANVADIAAALSARPGMASHRIGRERPLALVFRRHDEEEKHAVIH